MKRIAIFSAFLLIPLFSLFAQNQKVKKSEIIETLRGAPYYIHFVSTGETLIEIAEAYNVTTEEIIQANPEVSDGLKVNHVIKIPVKTTETESTDKIEPVPQKEIKTPGSSQTKTHLIEPKETWYGISRLYQVPVKDLVAANPGIDTLRVGMLLNIPEAGAATQPDAVSGHIQHTVQPQETLYSLSKKYGISVDDLVKLNPLLSEGLKTGMVLNVPSNNPESQVQKEKQDPLSSIKLDYREHVVEKKETLYSIARQYGISVDDILKANPGISGTVKKNDVIRIPVSSQGQKNIIPVPKEIGETKIVEADEKAIETPCGNKKGKNQQYVIALLIPFMLEEADSVRIGDVAELRQPSEYSSLDFIQFYEGALLAVDSLKKAGMNVRVLVFDTDAGEQVTKTRKVLANAELAGVDLIIGPFFARSFELVAAFAASHSIPVVNPLSQRSEILQGNPYVYKIQPSNWSQYNETARYIANNFSGSNVLIIRRNNDENTSMASTFKTAIEKHSAGMITVKEAVYSQSFDAGLFSNLMGGKRNLVLVLTSDKALLPALLRKLNDARTRYNITLFGLPDWEDLELDNQYLLNLNTHLFNGWFVDYNNKNVRRFVSNFNERYKTEPVMEEQAFLGYDISFFFLENLYNYGRGFNKCLSSIDHKGLSTGFTFWKTDLGGYENTASSVYELKDYKRRLVNR